MKNISKIQQQLFANIKDKALFEKSHDAGMTYLENVFDRNVYPTERALRNLKYFKEPLPSNTTNASDVLNLLVQYGAPATLPTLGGRYFGFVTGSTIPVGLAAKTLATYWDQVAAMHVLSPLSSTLESVTETWLKELLGLPENTVAGFVSGTSMANFCGLAAARYKLLKNLGWNINEQGLFNAPKLRIVAGKHAHSTILKAVSLLGFGKDLIEWVDVDKQGRIRADLVPTLDSSTILILQAGNVNTGSFDDFETLCKQAKKAGAWVHIDGAFGLWAATVKQLCHLTKGIELADSWAVDGHKTLNTPYDCGIVLCAHPLALKAALHMDGSYIITSKERDGMFYTPEMSRRARVIELWAIIKNLGKEGIDQMILGMHERATQFAKGLEPIKGFKVLNEVVFNQVLVQCETDEKTLATLARIQELRVCWVGVAVWEGKQVIRVSICSWATTSNDIELALGSFKQALSEVK